MQCDALYPNSAEAQQALMVSIAIHLAHNQLVLHEPGPEAKPNQMFRDTVNNCYTFCQVSFDPNQIFADGPQSDNANQSHQYDFSLSEMAAIREKVKEKKKNVEFQADEMARVLRASRLNVGGNEWKKHAVRNACYGWTIYNADGILVDAVR
jgi:hypothetical protein